MSYIAVVEDDAEQAERMCSYLEKYEKEKGIALEVIVFRNGIDFLTDYTHEFSAVFLDIQLPMMDGMSVAERLRQKDEDVLIVFVTNMAQYAIKGYKVNALDFLVKPVSEFEVFMELDKIFRHVKSKEKEYLYVNTPGGMRRVSFSEIYYVEMINHNICLHTKGGRARLP